MSNPNFKFKPRLNDHAAQEADVFITSRKYYNDNVPEDDKRWVVLKQKIDYLEKRLKK